MRNRRSAKRVRHPYQQRIPALVENQRRINPAAAKGSDGRGNRRHRRIDDERRTIGNIPARRRNQLLRPIAQRHALPRQRLPQPRPRRFGFAAHQPRHPANAGIGPARKTQRPRRRAARAADYRRAYRFGQIHHDGDYARTPQQNPARPYRYHRRPDRVYLQTAPLHLYPARNRRRHHKLADGGTKRYAPVPRRGLHRRSPQQGKYGIRDAARPNRPPVHFYAPRQHRAAVARTHTQLLPQRTAQANTDRHRPQPVRYRLPTPRPQKRQNRQDGGCRSAHQHARHPRLHPEGRPDEHQ